jgi:hypothetical protein
MPAAMFFDMPSKVTLDIIKFQALASTSPSLVGFFVQRRIVADPDASLSDCWAGAPAAPNISKA